MALSTKFTLPSPSFDASKFAPKWATQVAAPSTPIGKTDSKDSNTEMAPPSNNVTKENMARVPSAGTFPCATSSGECTADEDTIACSVGSEPKRAASVSEPGTAELLQHEAQETRSQLPVPGSSVESKMVQNLVARVKNVSDKMQQILDCIAVDVHACKQELEYVSGEMSDIFVPGLISQEKIDEPSRPDVQNNRAASIYAAGTRSKSTEEYFESASEGASEPSTPSEATGTQEQAVETAAKDIECGPASLISEKHFWLEDIPAPHDGESLNARRLVSIRRIRQVHSVRVEDRYMTVAQIDGWACMVPSGVFKAGELVIFCMIDSFLPASDKRFGKFASLQTFQGVLGYRVKTQRFGSHPNKLEVQGKVYSLQTFRHIYNEIVATRREMEKVPEDRPNEKAMTEIILSMYRNRDWAEELHVLKWVEPGQITPTESPRLGPIPTRVLRKTEIRQFEDCPNLFTKPKYDRHVYQESVKMDGASMTVYFVKESAKQFHDLNELPEGQVGPHMVLDTGRFGVCSKKVDLNELTMCQIGYWKVALLHDLPAKLSTLHRSIAIHGELCGPGINHNREKLTEPQFFVYSMWDVASQTYMDPHKVEEWAAKLQLKHVPVLRYVQITAIARSHEGLRQLANERPGEGLVYKCVQDGRSFKVHSTAYKRLHGC